MTSRDLRPLFEPRGVMIVGASSNPGKLGHAMASSLESFAGPVRLVNPRPTPGMYASIADAADGDIDLAVLCVPASVTADSLRECAANGVGAALVCAGGFAEAGGEGAAHAAAVDAAVAETGIRVLGPNTSGFFVPSNSLVASFVPGARSFDAGRVAVVAASGGVNHVLSFLLQQHAGGVSLGVGIGAGQDVAAPEVLRYLARHEATGAVILHIETVPDGRELLDAVRALSAAKPVVALIVGEADVSEFASSHTGALTTSWKVARSALRQAGAVLVADEDQAVAAAVALSAGRAAPAEAPGVGLITGQAGPGLIIADRLARDGIAVPRLAEATQTTLGTLLPPLTFQGNPIDTGRPSETFPAVVAAVSDDRGIDIVGIYAITEPVVDLASAVAESGALGRLPVVLGVDGPDDEVAAVREAAAARRIPVLRGPTRLAQGLEAVAEDARLRGRPHEPAPEVPAPSDVRAERWDEIRSKELLSGIGIATPPRRRCADRAEAHAALAEIGGPVAVKLVDAEVLHKTELGGVVLGVRDAAELDAALDSLQAAGAREFLVEAMAGPGVDLVVGARLDPAFGPIVALGLGGTTADALADVAIRTAPLGPVEAASMIDDLAGKALLDGFRGGPVVDRAALGGVVSRLAALLVSTGLAEIEINPLRLTGGGLVALDAVVLTRP